MVLCRKLAVVFLVACAYFPVASGLATAQPILNFEFLGSGQTFSPTDQVLIQARVTNTGPDPLTGAVGAGFALAPAQIFEQYIDLFPPGLAPFPPGVINLVPGASVTWDFALYDPFPIGGMPGDPVQPDTYVFPLTNISTSFNVFVPMFQTFPVSTDEASDFVWIVSENGISVPEPGTLALFGLGLAGLAVARRKKAA